MKKPVIGITRRCAADEGQEDPAYQFYRDSVLRAGGEPRSLHFGADPAAIPALLQELDGVLFTGGPDLDPGLYGEEWHPKAEPINPQRQAYELQLLGNAEKLNKPILGICLGCQLLNVARGGSLVQFLPEQERPDALEHRKVDEVIRCHDVLIDQSSTLGAAIGKA